MHNAVDLFMCMGDLNEHIDRFMEGIAYVKGIFKNVTSFAEKENCVSNT